MANLREIAIGIAQVLSSTSEPEPLEVQLPGESPENVGYLLEFIVNECVDAGIKLSKVSVSPEFLELAASLTRMNGVLLVTDHGLRSAIALHRG
jgi:hypothetical protein